MIKYLKGDVFDRMAELEDGSVDLILTSPPFLALRSYLPADHPLKDKEIGSESTPAEFVDVLLRLSAEWRRLLAPHGSIVIELGDTYAGSGGAGGDYDPGGWREGQEPFEGSALRHIDAKYERVQDDANHEASIRNLHGKKQMGGTGWPLAKSLALVPEAYRFALAYGINPHTGTESPAGQWRIRNVIRWVRPNPPVGALGDKFRPATSEMVVACVSDRRWFDLDAVREPGVTESGRPRGPKTGNAVEDQRDSLGSYEANIRGVPPLDWWEKDCSCGACGIDGSGYWWCAEESERLSGAPPLDWWKISPKGYEGAHYAVWPPELCVKPIEAMCPREVCRECGQPRRRRVETEKYGLRGSDETGTWERVDGWESGRSNKGDRSLIRNWRTVVVDESWSDCGHNNYRPGLVLDPFAGTGTTLLVAHGHGRDAIGIDIDARNAELAEQRIGGLFLEVHGH